MADVITITKLSALGGLKALVEEHGEEFVYSQNISGPGPSCVYVRDGEGSCMVGKFLAAVGIPLERLALADAGGGMTASELLYSLEDDGLIDFEPGLPFMLQATQNVQDLGRTWNEAYVAASRYI